MPIGPRGVLVGKDTYAAGVTEIFAAGNAIRTKGMVVRSVADGKEAALSIHQYLTRQAVSGPKRPFATRISRLHEEISQLIAHADAAGQQRAGLPAISARTKPRGRPHAACTATAAEWSNAACAAMRPPTAPNPGVIPARGENWCRSANARG